MTPVAKKATAAELRNTLLLEAAMDVDESDMGWFSRQCDDIIAAARAEAVAPYADVLRQLVAAMPKCDRCGAPAFSECYQYPRPSPIPYCPLCGPESGRHKLPHQDPLRAALALLAADQAGEKAGKP